MSEAHSGAIGEYHNSTDSALWRGGLAVVDQGLFAGANFILNLLLARWLSPTGYGAFALAYSAFLLVTAGHSALIVEPLVVFGAGRYACRWRTYLGKICRVHGVVVGLVSATCFIVAAWSWYSSGQAVANAFAGLGLMAPGVLTFWLARRGSYVGGDPYPAIVGSGLYALVALVGFYAIARFSSLTSAAAFMVMGLAGAVASTWLLLRLRPALWSTGVRLPLRLLLRRHVRYGRWSLATAALIWIPGNIYYAILPLAHGLGDGATLRAVYNAALPMLHASTAAGLVLMPEFAAAQHAAPGELRKQSRRWLVTLLGAATVYSILVWSLRRPLLLIAYDGNYADAVDLVAGMLVVALLSPLTAVYGSLLRALERPDTVFWVYLASTVVTLTLGVPLAITKGAWGGMLGLAITQAVTAFAFVWTTRKVWTPR